MFYYDDRASAEEDPPDDIFNGDVVVETWHPFDLSGAQIIDVEPEPVPAWPTYAEPGWVSGAAVEDAPAGLAHPPAPVTWTRVPAALPNDDLAIDEETALAAWPEAWVTRIASSGMELAALALLVFMLGAILFDQQGAASAEGVDRPVPAAVIPTAPPPTPPPYRAVIAPYAPGTFWVTQGHHGASYGHLAIDIAAGKGAPILSPIDGKVTGNYLDVWGNPTLVIENERYRVTLLHGDYTVAVGETIIQGLTVGVESNRGYTRDMQGRSCQGRDCGYHTHLNVFDKASGQNVDPLALLGMGQ